MPPISPSTEVRLARAEDREAIDHVLRAAFEAPDEARLVEKLEDAGDAAVSLVAEQDGAVVGHVLLSRMQASADGRPVTAMAVGPLAVLPDRQRRGVGERLMKAAIMAARQLEVEILFLLGEPDYYARFGFSCRAAQAFESPYGGPYWQALAIDERLADAHSGTAVHAPAFAMFEQ
ncbi:GNAT family N-acetyltransferase [Sphingomicrobium lutaoense]|uniref:Putative acetyltransferase n=1 Tax=Sphingomicrobium lutaoense TaxID=515949 RepID=A0A839YS48_9SPHN|nr:N-acetyltransferase [Sphingomicrobium lutaoense]MBB3763111.1 putative acetyltransferase [Sphingomicrobium lutaoense]